MIKAEPALKLTLAVALAGAAILEVGESYAQTVPPLINYSASLADSSGRPANGSKTMTFRVFDDPVLSLGHELWEETQTVQVSSGVFSVQLGSATAWSFSVFAAPSTYLEVQVGSDVLSPRARLVASPYAANAQLLQGQGLSAFVLKDASGNVGIGTTAPAAKLEVSGGVKVGNDAAACDASKAGTIIWTGSDFEGCNGSAWVGLVLAGCSPACQNGGTCSAPNTCSCPAGYTGSTCGTPICNPVCQNGGMCAAPNVCTCSGGYSGPTCGSWSCSPLCQNGGTCTAPNTCNCPAGYTGSTCGTPPYTLTVTPAGTGSGAVTSSPAGINCGSTCSAGFASGTLVTLTAAAYSGSTFAGWTGGGCSGTGACTVTMSAGQAVTATFNPVVVAGGGTLNVARYYHTATLLNNGKVLVAGGYGSGGRLNSAELYDPVAGSWALTGSMPQALGSPEAVLLNSGMVLAAGGYSGDGYNVAAMLYNPNSGAWSGTGNLNTQHIASAAVLLSNGKVLLAGGQASGGNYLTNAAELYDPNAGTWSYTGSMGSARRNFPMLVLPSGKVLAAGGDDSNVSANIVLAACELYDPTAGTWSGTGSMNATRTNQTATMLGGGNVLVAGGTDASSTFFNSAELYNPASGTWSLTGSMSVARQAHTASLLNSGKVLVAGGQTIGGAIVNSAELYDPTSATWSSTTSMNNARYAHASAFFAGSGKVLVAGGYNGGPLSSAELYDPSAATWK